MEKSEGLNCSLPFLYSDYHALMFSTVHDLPTVGYKLFNFISHGET